MTVQYISKIIAVKRLKFISEMIRDIKSLPLNYQKQFLADHRNAWAAESCLRRSIEAVLDLGRHILAKGYALAITEYEKIALKLKEEKVLLSSEQADLMRILAGYRNRMVHFYHEVSKEEIYKICSSQLGDVEQIVEALKTWLKNHPEKLDEEL